MAAQKTLRTEACIGLAHSLFAFCFILAVVAPGIALADEHHDWPQWRGPERNGHANSEQNPPVEWSEDQNIAWKTAIPGKGHGSPIVVSDRVYIATSVDEEETRSLICLNRGNGKILWNAVVHQGKATPARNKKGTQASSTPAWDGERLLINFLHDNSMYTSAVSVSGDILWQTRITGYVVHQGFGSSPLVYNDLVIVSADNKSGGAIAGLDRKSGQIVWKKDRPEKPNYPSPVILNVAGQRQLIMTGCDLVTSLNPQTGEENWEVEGATTECVTTSLSHGDILFTSGGYPTNHISAVKADGSGEIVWKNGVRVYVPSMLVKSDHLYGVTDAGVAMCWDARTGEEIWKGRLGGTFSSSPVLVGERIYATNEEGETFLFLADASQFQLIGKNQLGNVCFASPAICGNQIITRVAEVRGESRQEYVYCIAE